eukprot:GHVR01060420.1.p1 GENE.GHVR01060420.1~~GHVR01060420.1.p1  ORF type:complete len:246 (+),score=129.18 GHVR01060420.1:7-744(+)
MKVNTSIDNDVYSVDTRPSVAQTTLAQSFLYRFAVPKEKENEFVEEVNEYNKSNNDNIWMRVQLDRQSRLLERQVTQSNVIQKDLCSTVRDLLNRNATTSVEGHCTHTHTHQIIEKVSKLAQDTSTVKTVCEEISAQAQHTQARLDVALHQIEQMNSSNNNKTELKEVLFEATDAAARRAALLTSNTLKQEIVDAFDISNTHTHTHTHTHIHTQGDISSAIARRIEIELKKSTDAHTHTHTHTQN